MNNSIIELVKKFELIKNNQWIESESKGPSGIGITFEKYIGKDKDNLPVSDFKGVEIKTCNYLSKFYISLFNSTPKSKNNKSIKDLVQKYGYPDKTFKQYNILQGNIYADCCNLIGSNYIFRLDVNKQEKKIYILIFNKSYSLISKTFYWNFEDLNSIIYNKLQVLALIHGNKKIYNNTTYFKYCKIIFYKIKGFDKFIELIENGKIRVQLKVGIFKTGKRLGQIHDHGCSFEISKKDLDKLFTELIL